MDNPIYSQGLGKSYNYGNTCYSKRKNQNTVEIVSQPKEPYQPAKQPDLWRSFENPMKLIMGKILQNSPAS